MRKYLYIVLAFIPLLMSCNELSKLTKLDVPFSQNTTLPALPIIVTDASILTPSTSIDSLLTAYKVSSDLIQSVSLKKMNLTLTDPVDGDFTFLKSIQIYMVADGLTEVKVSGIDSISNTTGSTLALNVESVDLKSFAKKNKFQMKILLSTDKPTAVEYKLKIDMSLQLDLKILGL
jgi:hypothetical protein